MQRMKHPHVFMLTICLLGALAASYSLIGHAASVSDETPDAPPAADYAGTSSCRACHENFYKLWAPSHHGLAMQPFTDTFAQAELTEHQGQIQVGSYHYQAFVGPGQGFVKETGPAGNKQYKIEHVLGGKNVYYFLAPWQGGRLQTLPVAYNVNTETWYDTAASGVRHFPGAEQDSAVHWTDPLYTFNTSCYDCHVSQLATNYDRATDSYNTVWAEPGINCETCHGPSEEHVRLFTADPNHDPNDLGLISTHSFNREQTNSMCNSCHAKMSPITASFIAGERFFDHFDLITLENPDFYSDGRDLGENYTMTTWRMSACFKAGELDCMHCHTSSGRYRFKERKDAFGACLPCHQENVDHYEAHTHHPPGDDTPVCIDCHMPMTSFAHMNRSDHSMRPPTPGVSKEFKSDVACLLCHQHKNEKDVVWADSQVRQWHKHDYQKPYLERARLLEEARHDRWQNLDRILTYIAAPEREEILTASLIRTLIGCMDAKKWPVLIDVLERDTSPLVRSAAASGLDNYYSPVSVKALVKATQDDYRLVRVRAAASLASLPTEHIPAAGRKAVAAATEELKVSFTSRQDDFAAHFNRGNFYMNRRNYEAAIEAFGATNQLRPDFMAAYVNRAFAYNAKGQNEQAEKAMRQALDIDPNNGIVHMNLGMLLGELERTDEAKAAFKRSFQLDPNNAQSAYNLGVILASKDPGASTAWCKKAYDLQPEEAKYGYTYAFYLLQQNQVDRAMDVLEEQIKTRVAETDSYMLLADIYRRQNQPQQVRWVWEQALQNLTLSPEDRALLERQIQSLP
ncbi:tetratricopeptide repeat protein [Planctomycetota bacterium]